LSSIPRPSGRHIKWALVSHAVFLGGWRPDWIDESTGEVKLRKTAHMERMPEESRLEWRERLRQAPFIGAKLVAACVSKPIHFSGWDLTLESTDKEGRQKLGGPKPTMLAVPAGSVYYFEADSDEDAKALVAALHGRTRSDCMGEKGMGYGFCGTWEEMTDVGGRSFHTD
jgi:CRISPR/Cas system CMR-associated protein Cmr3 (group 5 of RAMP superfamily)